jgi:hypothetical protein
LYKNETHKKIVNKKLENNKWINFGGNIGKKIGCKVLKQKFGENLEN